MNGVKELMPLQHMRDRQFHSGVGDWAITLINRITRGVAFIRTERARRVRQTGQPTVDAIVPDTESTGLREERRDERRRTSQTVAMK